MFSLDLHVHSRFFHGWGPRATPFDPLGARMVTAMANHRDLDGLAFTNHDYHWLPDRSSLTTIPGIEISTTRGHVLVVGPDPPTATKLGAVTPQQAVDMAHEGGCAAIMAHPFRNGDLPETDVEFDALEINGKQPGNRQAVERLAEERGVPLVGGSDAHYPIEVGRAYTRFDADEPSPEGVVEAIRDGRVTPIQANRGLDRALSPIYEAIHRHKGHLREKTPDVEKPKKIADAATPGGVGKSGDDGQTDDTPVDTEKPAPEEAQESEGTLPSGENQQSEGTRPSEEPQPPDETAQSEPQASAQSGSGS